MNGLGAVPTTERLFELGLRHTCDGDSGGSCYLCAVGQVHELGFHIDSLTEGIDKLRTFHKEGHDALIEYVLVLRSGLSLAESYIRKHSTPTTHQLAVLEHLRNLQHTEGVYESACRH